MKTNSIKEKFLLYKVRYQHDATAYGLLYDLYVAKIFRFILYKVSSVEDAEDITAEVFLKSWQYIKTTDKKISNFNALLYRVARNAVIDYYRQKKRQDLPLTDEDQYHNIVDSRDVEKDIDIKLEVKNIEQALDQIKDEYREVVILRYVEGLSVNEIASIIKKSKSNVRVLLHRAIKRIQEILGE
ncbi:hypothetical protein COT97_04285 [Candidatus Falkowbacteria bacterium CG10_big_fil_rev_8_21_14_0_10_39_11]|uniref:RNA polymerase sigma factor n=1 Tax=Candidatus Falkowbacteria bacterium CG10_big_fil_rev_8_21_14_0_10_39_11 TaxID=1974565 RepID=A0A2H0V4A1_9BACT|nr:MAG: hypothetical protein COT97_04285 [Candidatus Falkowbacteria bacterium CG10_big_fil_rev_8_21_14_0_10_39_11]